MAAEALTALKSMVWGAVSPGKPGGSSGDCFDVRAEAGCVFLALSDGAGGAAYGALGARKAVDIFLKVATERLSEFMEPCTEAPVQQERLRALLRGVQAHYLVETQLENEGADYACTLLGAIVTPTALWALQVGDGVLVAHGDAAEAPMRILFTPDQDFINEPLFLGDNDMVNRAQMACYERPDFLGLTSDGLAAVAVERLPQPAPYPGFWAPLARGVCQALNAALQSDTATDHWLEIPHADLTHFLSSEAVGRRVQDDRSLVVAAFTRGVR